MDTIDKFCSDCVHKDVDYEEAPCHGCYGTMKKPNYSNAAMQQDAPVTVTAGRPEKLKDLKYVQGAERVTAAEINAQQAQVDTAVGAGIGRIAVVDAMFIDEFQRERGRWSKLNPPAKPKDAQGAPAYPDDNPKTVQGLRKVSLSTLPTGALFHMAKAMEDGKRKYGHMNWRDAKVTASTYLDAATRHHLAYLDGENVAEDSLAHHLGHAMACYAIILDALECGMLNDDRPTPGPFARLVKESTKPLA